MADFVHLHNHTHYSLLDAMNTPNDLINAAIADGHPAVALTDHGVMFGTYEFYKAAKKAAKAVKENGGKFKPIVGMEAYIANGSRFDRGAIKGDKKKRNYFHIIFLAKDFEGYQNLMKLTSIAHTEGFYYKPRIDKELIEKYHKGLICTSACMGSMVNAHIVEGNFDIAMNEAKYYKDLFGDDFYLEIQNHGLEADPLILRDVPKIAKALDLKMIATNDIHYLKKEHAIAHNVLLNIRDSNAANSGTVDVRQLRYKVPEFYFKTEAEMKILFKDFPESLTNTLEVAEKCNLDLDIKISMPQFPIPENSKSTNLDEYLTELVYNGLEKRYEVITDDIKNRTEYELTVIRNMGFAGYFLIVWDFIDAARRLGVSVGPGRGSAAGSLIAYAIGITNVDPLPYDLLFERFLNPERVSMPDIDIDFNDEKREIVIEYVKQKYGADAVAQIITFGKLSSKAVLTDVGRVLGVELSTVKNITKCIPTVLGRVYTIKEALELPELKWINETNDQKIKDLIEYSLLLEGKFRHTGIHAAGVVIAPGEITNFVPIYNNAKSKDTDVELATQYSMKELEDAGLLKMDFLGLQTLSIIDNTLDMIEKNHGISIDIDKIDFHDQKTFDLMSEGDTLGVFQFESPGMQDYLRKLKPQNLEEITAMNALYRPGPMANIPDFIDRKFGRKEIEYLAPIMEKVLNKTNGIIVYQEQVMQLCQVVANFSLGEADLLRRAMGKKQREYMDQMKPKFIEGAASNNISEEIANEIFDLIYKFADYGFNKSHSLAYSYLAYQTAFLKTHYPAEFLAANMTAELNSQDKIVELIDEAKKFGIDIYPPDINESVAKFKAVGNTIYFGLAGIKNVGINAVESIIKAREEKKFTSFFDFVSRVDTRLTNKRTLEALICAGAFDKISDKKRRALFDSIDSAIIYAKAVNENNDSSMESLFGESAPSQLKEPTLPSVEEWRDKERLIKEKEVLSFYVSGHPLKIYEIQVKSLSNKKISELINCEENSVVRICGLVADIRTRRDKKDRMIAFAQIEDFSGKVECCFWSKQYEKCGDALLQDSIVVIIGKVQISDDGVKIIADDAFQMNDAINKMVDGLNIWSTLDDKALEKVQKLHSLVNDFFNPRRINFFFKKMDSPNTTNYSAMEVNIPIDSDSLNKISNIFGLNNVRLSVKS